MTFLPILSKRQLKSVLRFLKKRTISMYSNDEDKVRHILSTLNRFFQFRMDDYTSKYDVLHVIQSIAKYFCFVSDTADFALCTWSELVSRTFLVVPSIKLLNKKRMCFRFKKTKFVVHEDLYLHENGFQELTVNLTILKSV
jgi:hypothetical protein